MHCHSVAWWPSPLQQSVITSLAKHCWYCGSCLSAVRGRCLRHTLSTLHWSECYQNFLQTPAIWLVLTSWTFKWMWKLTFHNCPNRVCEQLNRWPYHSVTDIVLFQNQNKSTLTLIHTYMLHANHSFVFQYDNFKFRASEGFHSLSVVALVGALHWNHRIIPEESISRNEEKRIYHPYTCVGILQSLW